MQRIIQSLGSSAVFITLALTLETKAIYSYMLIGLSAILLIFSVREYFKIRRKQA